MNALVARRRATPRVLSDRQILTTWKCHGRKVVRGQQVSITGERGRFTFLAYVHTDKGVEWIDVLSPLGGFRAFRPNRVRTVHNARSA